MGFFERIKKGLSKARDGLSNKLLRTFMQHKYVDEDLYEELEEILITSDISVDIVMNLLEDLKDQAIKERVTDAMQLYEMLQSHMANLMPEASTLQLPANKISVILVVGVNGVGKTTTIGKLSAQLKQNGKKVMMVAADTFRAAAADQLEIWAKRTDSLIVRHKEGGDPAAVIYDAIHSARAKDVDVLIVDTAGRLHNKKNLMNELAKINRVLQNELPGAPHEALLVIDATTGQNGLLQAEAFNEATNLSGLILTKMDGTAKGGVIFNIASTYNLPVKFIGIGEKVSDLLPFEKTEFIQALFNNVK